MKYFSSISRLAAAVLPLGFLLVPAQPAKAQGRHLAAASAGRTTLAAIGKDGGANGAFTYSADPAVAAAQHVVKATIETYQKGLDSSDTNAILPLFADDAVVEWTGKPTFVGQDALTVPYQQLFQDSKFTTEFQYDAVDVYDNIAIVRTHHLKGQTELNLKDGSKTLDFNRELFILRKTGADWKIILYSFNTQPQQGVQ